MQLMESFEAKKKKRDKRISMEIYRYTHSEALRYFSVRSFRFSTPTVIIYSMEWADPSKVIGNGKLVKRERHGTKRKHWWLHTRKRNDFRLLHDFCVSAVSSCRSSCEWGARGENDPWKSGRVSRPSSRKTNNTQVQTGYTVHMWWRVQISPLSLSLLPSHVVAKIWTITRAHHCLCV